MDEQQLQILIQELHNIKREIIEKLEEIRLQGVDIENELRHTGRN